MTVKIPAQGGGVVHHALLQPQRRKLEANALLNDPRDMLGAAEHIDNIHPVASAQHFAQLLERGDRRLAQDALGRWRHRNDPVPEALQRARDPVARPARIGGQSQDGDGAGAAQQLGDFTGRWIREHGDSLAFGSVASSLVNC